MTETPAQIAARYGAAIADGVTVQHVEQGASSYVLPVWNGRQLVSGESRAEMIARVKRITARNMNAQRRRISAANKSPEVQARREKVAELHGNGMTNAQIAEATGQSLETLYNDLSILGLHANRGATKRTISGDPEIVAKVRECFNNGFGVKKTATHINIGYEAVRYIRDKYGLKPKTKPCVKKIAGSRRSIASENLARVKAAIAEGLDFDGICDRAQVTPEQLRAFNRHHKLNVYAPKRKYPPQQNHHVIAWRKHVTGAEPGKRELHAKEVEKRRDEVVRLRGEDLTVTEIAERLKVGESTIQRDLRERGVKAPHIKQKAKYTGQRAVWKAQQDARRAKLLAIVEKENLTQRELAQRLNSNAATICKDMKALGLSGDMREAAE